MPHRLHIKHRPDNFYAFEGHITFNCGIGYVALDADPDTVVYGSDRERCIARASEVIVAHCGTAPIPEGEEVLFLDDDGIIIREPIEWSVRA